MTPDSLPSDDLTDTQARIVQAALELFAEHSYEAATTQAIAKRAGVTERTLFRHFGSKENLFSKTLYPALLKLLEPIAIERLRRVFAERASFPELIRAAVADRLKFATAHPTIVKMVAQEMLLRPAFREAVAGFFDAQMRPSVAEAFARARQNGEMRDVSDATALRTIVSLIGGYIFTRLLFTAERPHDDARDIDELTALILGALRA